MIDSAILDFLSQYSDEVKSNALKLQEIVINALPGVKEQLDLPARMIGYCYGKKYSELICVIIPSKKGLKLGFSRGVQLDDPEGLLRGSGKLSRYVEIKTENDNSSKSLRALIDQSLKLYNEQRR